MGELFSTISDNNTFPSLVSLICPDPSTSILIVPFGPRFVRRTSCNPFAAVMFTCGVSYINLGAMLLEELVRDEWSLRLDLEVRASLLRREGVLVFARKRKCAPDWKIYWSRLKF
jgi:hypothetical protein